MEDPCKLTVGVLPGASRDFVAGKSSAHKEVELAGLSEEEVRARLPSLEGGT